MPGCSLHMTRLTQSASLPNPSIPPRLATSGGCLPLGRVIGQSNGVAMGEGVAGYAARPDESAEIASSAQISSPNNRLIVLPSGAGHSRLPEVQRGCLVGSRINLFELPESRSGRYRGAGSAPVAKAK